jgi:dTDP-4-dehydrorhamnose 3,5-epimerase-like enzyme
MYNKILLPKFSDERGDLTVIEGLQNVPFDIKRIFYIHDAPFDTERGSHAHKKCEQFIIAISGTFVVEVVKDEKNYARMTLNAPNFGIYIKPMTWTTLTNFSSDAICLVLASENYSKEDYINDYDLFLKMRKNEI